MTDQRPTLADKVLEVLRGTPGEWLTRKEIAARLGRPNAVITPHDVTVLERLVYEGKAEVRQQPLGVVKTEYAYRAVLK